MEKTPFQMTVKELEEYLSANFRNTGTYSSLGEALEMIEKKYLLSAVSCRDGIEAPANS